MTPINLQPLDVAIAGLLLVLDAGLSLALGLRVHRAILVAALRMVMQLVLIGFVLRAVFATGSGMITFSLIIVMTAVAAREAAVRPARRLAGWSNHFVSAAAVGGATALAALLALTTALRPSPWWDPRYAIPVAGIILGGALNAASLALDSVLGGVAAARQGIEAQLALGAPFRSATQALVNDAIRRGLVPALNQMAAAGVVTLPGTMTGQILAGLDPVEAVKYQILLMLLLSGAAGLAAGMAAILAIRRLTDGRDRLRLDRLTR